MTPLSCLAFREQARASGDSGFFWDMTCVVVRLPTSETFDASARYPSVIEICLLCNPAVASGG